MFLLLHFQSILPPFVETAIIQAWITHSVLITARKGMSFLCVQAHYIIFLHRNTLLSASSSS